MGGYGVVECLWAALDWLFNHKYNYTYYNIILKPTPTYSERSECREPSNNTE